MIALIGWPCAQTVNNDEDTTSAMGMAPHRQGLAVGPLKHGRAGDANFFHGAQGRGACGAALQLQDTVWHTAGRDGKSAQEGGDAVGDPGHVMLIQVVRPGFISASQDPQRSRGVSSCNFQTSIQQFT